jgi:glycosyltransferase involved in cell wall biosynthesis
LSTSERYRSPLSGTYAQPVERCGCAKRFAFISANEWAPWGGSEVCWAAAAERLVRRGAAVSVSVKHWDRSVKEIERLQSAGCKIFYRPKATLLRRARRALTGREDACKLVAKLGNESDLVVVSQGNTHEGFPWLEAARAQRVPYAIIVQAASENWWQPDDIGERLAVCYEGARAVYFVSEANMSLVRRQFTTPLERARVIRNPFNVRYNAQPPWPDSSDGLSLACVARLEILQKAQDLLIKVLSLPHWRSRNVKLTFVGSGMNDRILHRLVEMSELENIEFASFVDDIERLWSQHHALVLASRYEGMPLALVEAMLCGRPCIVTDVGGNRELVRDGANGFLAKAPTVEFLDEAMNRGWDNRHRLREMGERAASDVRQWVSADPTEDFVRDLVALAIRDGRLQPALLAQAAPNNR